LFNEPRTSADDLVVAIRVTFEIDVFDGERIAFNMAKGYFCFGREAGYGP
jgi:hypothetical protein